MSSTWSINFFVTFGIFYHLQDYQFITPPMANAQQNVTFVIDKTSEPESLESSPSEETTRIMDFNKTLDMTLRSSGPSAFGLGVLLAIDEMLDPVLGFLLPYGLRRRGANLALATASLFVGGLAWMFSVKR